MKAIEQYLVVVLFVILLYKVGAKKNLCMKSLSVTIQLKGIEQFFVVALCGIKGGSIC